MALFQILVLVLMIITITAAKRNFTKTGYFPVPVCPKNTQEWQASSQRLNCNDTHKYHCAPYRDLTQLYEFCYERTSLKVGKGFCIGIAESGILNLLTCSIFSHGCPPEDYDSNQLYKYPSCISIHNGCFTEDCVCKCQSAGKQSGQTGESASYKNQTGYLVAFVVCLVLLIPSFVANIVLIRSFKCNQPKQRKQGDNTNAFADEEQRQSGGRTDAFADEEHHLLSRDNTNAPADEEELQEVDNKNILADEEQHALSGDNTNAPADEEQRQEDEEQHAFSGDNTNAPADEEQRQEDEKQLALSGLRKKGAELNPVFRSQQEVADESDCTTEACGTADEHLLVDKATDDIFKLTLVNYTIEDAELFQLLKRQCLHEAYPGFRYLIKTRDTDKRESILEKHDENGCTLLHYAAQGGNIVILELILDMLKTKADEILQHTCMRGQNALHVAIKYKNEDMAVHLIQQYPSLYNFNQNKNVRAFAPVHWVAWHGNQRLLHELEEKTGVDIWIKTKNGLNILDIACMAKSTEESIKFSLYLLKKIDIPGLQKNYASEWNIAHYASRSNKVALLKSIKEKEIQANEKGNNESLIVKTTKTSKTCLHIACEFARYEAVNFILTEFESIRYLEDDLGWNALHFAAKGGNLDILKELHITYKIPIGCLTKDRKTILHIACIHKHPNICRYAVECFHETLLNVQTNTSGLTAAHYLAVEKKEDGSETKILEILCRSEMDLSATCFMGYNQLEWAIDHLNFELISAIVSPKFRDRCGVTPKSISNVMEKTINKKITKFLETALEEMNKK